MGDKVEVDFSNLSPNAKAWLRRFGDSLRLLGTLVHQAGTGQRTLHAILDNLAYRWPEETKAGRQQLTRLMEDMAGDAGFLASGSDPENRQVFTELACVLQRLFFAMNEEDTWQEEKFSVWLKKAGLSDDEYFQEVKRERRTNLDQTSTTD